MRLAAVIIALAWLGEPARAQDVSFNADSIELCLMTTRGAMGAEECIGFAARACMARPGGETKEGAASCRQAEQRFWDARLGEAHEMLMALDRQDDALSAGLGPEAARRADALTRMTEAWSDYRDAACGYLRAQWGGSKGGGQALSDCLMRMTALQALELERLAARR